MGFFSYNCLGCGYSLRSHHFTSDNSKWMSKAVVMTKRGGKWEGVYDGYGRIDGHEMGFSQRYACWHKACHQIVGEPEFTEPSARSEDQGMGSKGTWNLPEPKTAEDIEALRARTKEEDETAPAAAGVLDGLTLL